MIEQANPVEENPQPRRRRYGLIVGVVIGALLLLLVAALIANNVVYRSTFTRLVEATETAETDQVWISFFQDQDCFLDAALVEGDIDLTIAEGLKFRDTAEILAAHVDGSLSIFSDIRVQGFHGPIASARGAIIAHYTVWDEHLSKAIPILSTLGGDESDVINTFQAWIDVLAGDVDQIESTFNNAEKAFLDAARGADAIDRVDALFTPADIACTRGAV